MLRAKAFVPLLIISSFVFALSSLSSPVAVADSNDYLDQRWGSEHQDSTLRITYSGAKKKSASSADNKESFPRKPSRKRKPELRVTRLTRFELCINKVMAGRGYDYLDRISAGFDRKRFGVPSVSAQLSTLSAAERAVYDDCLKGHGKPSKAKKINKAKATPSVVAMLKESKEFVVPKAGVRIQPEGRHIPSKPAIISTDKDRQEFDFVLGGQTVHLRFVAKRYEADLGDGGPLLSQAGKPVPYPEALKGKFYRNFVKEGSFVVTLRTYWQVEWFNPATGQWVVEAEPMVSEEKSQPQLVKPYNYVLTDDAEQEYGR